MSQEASEKRTLDQDRDTNESMYVYMDATNEANIYRQCTEIAGRVLAAVGRQTCVQAVLRWPGKVPQYRLTHFHTSLVDTMSHFVNMSREVAPEAFPGFRLQSLHPIRPGPKTKQEKHWAQEQEYLSYIRVTLSEVHESTVVQKPDTDSSPQEVIEHFQTAANKFEREYLMQLLEACGKHFSNAARRSGISRPRLRALLNKHGLQTAILRSDR